MEAQREWEHTIAVDPKNARALYNLGFMYQDAGRTEDAGKMYCRFVSSAGDSFPSEKAVAAKSIETMGTKCQD